MRQQTLMPVLYIPHGGGPLPIMGDANHRELIQFLKSVQHGLPKPLAILMISAHWENKIAAISAATHPKMIYDYVGFPPQTYRYEYPAPGQPQLAQKVSECLQAVGIACELNPSRGYDHGTFIPLMLMYPEADIPVVQLSLLSSLDPEQHIAMGLAIASLREQGVLIIGSGMSFHEWSGTLAQSKVFDDWLTDALNCPVPEMTKSKLIHWEQAPSARHCHRREEHLLPLHVCFGAASVKSASTQKIYTGLLFGKQISAFLWA